VRVLGTFEDKMNDVAKSFEATDDCVAFSVAAFSLASKFLSQPTSSEPSR
jgi:hypothetical protein